MSDNVTTVINPESDESRSFAFDQSYWSHSGFIENKEGINVGNDPSLHYADQVIINHLFVLKLFNLSLSDILYLWCLIARFSLCHFVYFSGVCSRILVRGY